MKCPHCQKDVSDTATICLHCGTALPAPAASQTVITSQVTVAQLTAGQAAGVVIERMNVNGAVIININGWQLFAGNSPLSKTGDVAETIRDTTQIKDNLEKLGQPAVLPGPVLLGYLLQSYQQRCAEPLTMEQDASDNLKCFNQDSVRRKINQLSSVRLIELSGPSGIGKSHVLRAICCTEEERQRRGIPAHEWNLWQTIYVDAQNQSISFNEIMHAFMAAWLPECASHHDRSDLRELLMQASIEGKYHFLFVLDSADQIALDVLVELVGDDGPIGCNTREALVLGEVRTLRLVIASRRPRLSQQLIRDKSLQVSLQSIQMDPLGLETIRSMLTERFQARINRPTLNQEEIIDQMATHILQISGGLPHAVDVILRTLEQRHFAVPPGTFQSLFQPMVLRMVEQDVIGDLSLKEYLLLNVLSIFRHFHVREVEYLLECGLLPMNLLESQERSHITALRMWLDRLCESPALIRRRVDTQRGFIVHPVLRHVLPLDLAHTAPVLLGQMHLIAHTLYNQGLRQRDSEQIRLLMSLTIRPAYTLEALYHYVQSQLHHGSTATAMLASGKGNDDLLTLARDYLLLYREAYLKEQGGFEHDPFALRYSWQQDEELRTSIVRLPHGSKLLERLDTLFCATIESVEPEVPA